MAAIERENELQCTENGIGEIGGKANGPFTQNGFEFGPEHFDGVEVGTVRRQIEQRNARRAEDLFDLIDMMRAHVIHDVNIARTQTGNQLILEEAYEPLPGGTALVGGEHHVPALAHGGEYRQALRGIQRHMIDHSGLTNAAPVAGTWCLPPTRAVPPGRGS